MARKYLTSNPSGSIDRAVEELNPDKVVVLTDTNVEKQVFPGLQESHFIKSSPRFVVKAGEGSKDISTVINLWNRMEETECTRHSILINIGGGMVTDLGGFAASTFKRGMRVMNFPTTLLGAVDAATGGKTGINFNGLKNEIGTFHLPSYVIISAKPFSTLPYDEILSGYAEMVKTAAISDRGFYLSLLDIKKVVENEDTLGKCVDKCVAVKDEIVAQDPLEKNLRKVLNFGHTAGHAFESLSMEKGFPVSHGKAVAHGIMVAMILSHLLLGFDSGELYHYAGFLKQNYGRPLLKCDEIEDAVGKMNSDKKNFRHGEPLFTLLKSIGVPEINVEVRSEDIKEALEIYIDMIG